MYFFRSFKICSAHVSALVIVLSDSPCERIGNLSDFERGQMIGASGVSRVTDSKVMSAYTNHGKRISAESNSGRKSGLTERDRCTLRRAVLKNHRITATQVNCGRTEYSS
jgi:hypothetical protein